MFNDTEIINKYASDEMVFVIPAYRMGIFGFMDLGQELKDAPYNVGFQGKVAILAFYDYNLDIIMALRWVQKEIRAVGGDSKRITCMGNSGGGTAVEYLMVSPVLEPNTFEKVIIESGIASFSPHVNLKMTKLTIEKIGVRMIILK
jgi:para-nitrobenzyl esterase